MIKNKIILLVFFTLPYNITFSEVPGQNIDYNSAKSDTIKSAKSIKIFGALDAAKLIMENIEQFEKIKLKISEAKKVDDVIDEVADKLYEISKTYEKIIANKTNILQTHEKSLNVISNIDTKIIDKSIKENNEKITTIKKEISELNNSIIDKLNRIQKRRLEININSKKSVVNSLLAKNKVWNNFRKIQAKLLKKLKTNSEIIDLFMFTMEKNAEVYKEAADVAMLRKNAKSMLSQLVSLNSTDDVIKDIESNWEEINNLMDEISKSDFDIQWKMITL